MREPKIKSFIRLLRLHQWAKNCLLFIPACVSLQIFQTNVWIDYVLGFFAFSFFASSVYIMNDILDLDSDRLHPEKKKRPLASGTLSIEAALGGFAVFLDEDG